MCRSGKMKYEHLVIPEYFKLENIEGSTLTKILHTEDWLHELRKVYKEDPNLFFDIRDELILRGFSFEKSIQNNFFPKKAFEPIRYVRVHKDNQNFMHLDIDATGINYLIRRYHVQSDLFFNYITIEGIAHILKKNSELITRCLKNAQFQIIHAQDNTSEIMIGVKKDNVKEYVENQGNIGQFNIAERTKDVDCYREEMEEQFNYGSLNDKSIEQLFFEGKFKMFVKYCAENNIKKFSDITVDKIENYSMQLGVGRRKVFYVKSRYDELKQQGIKIAETPTFYEMKKTTELDEMISYFCENDLKLILEGNDISYLTFLDDVYAEGNYSRINEKIKNFHERLPNMIKNAQLKVAQLKAGELRLKISCLPVYEELMNFKWSVLAELLGINLEDYPNMDSELHLHEMLDDDECASTYSSIYARMKVYIPIKQAIRGIGEDLSDREILTLKLRSENKTLEEVGKQFSVTRERVRQIEKKAVNKIRSRLLMLKVDEYIRKYLLREELVSLESILTNLVIDENSEVIILYHIFTHEAFEIRDGIVIDMELNNYILGIVSMYKGNSKAIILVDELLNKINEDKQFEVTIEKLDFAMKNISYKRQNDIYIYKSVSLQQLIMYIFKYKLKGQPFELTDENFEELNELMNKTFGIIFENGKRAAIARIRDTENIVYVDRNTFVYKELDTIDPAIIEDIEAKLNSILDTMNTTTGTALFEKFRNTWEKYGITSVLYLYSIVQHHFKGQYQIGRGNTLSIMKLDAEVEYASDSLENLLRRNNNVMSKTDILKELHWPSYKLEQLVSREPQFILVEIENNKYGVRLFSSYNFKHSELEQMRVFARQFITEDYVYTQDLMFEMEFDNEMSAILADKGIYKLYDFASLLKVLMPEFRGFHQFIYNSNSEVKVIEDAIFKEYTTILTRQDLISFLKDKGYSENSYTSIVVDLQEKGYFYPYTSVKFINRSCLNITEQVLQEVKGYFENVLQDRDYISAYDLVNFSELTKISDYSWEPNLLASFAEKLGYAIIDTTKDYRYNKVLIVDPMLNISFIDELAYKLIREDYDGNYHESDIAKFLKIKKLSHTTNMTSAIKMSPLFAFDQYGYMTLLEV